MAKKSKVVKNIQRQKLVDRFASKRAELLAIVKSPKTSFAEKRLAYQKLEKMPRDANPIRLRNRCNLNHIFLLIDSKVGIKDLDIDMIDLINDCSKKFSIVLTKIDKVSKKQIDYESNSILSLMENYKETFENIFVSETKKNNGIIDIQKTIYKISH